MGLKTHNVIRDEIKTNELDGFSSVFEFKSESSGLSLIHCPRGTQFD